MKRLTDWDLSDLGINHPDYFQGFGTAFSRYSDCTYGIGDNPREALTDCLESMSSMVDGCDLDQLEKDILEQYPEFTKPEKELPSAYRDWLESRGCDCDPDCICDECDSDLTHYSAYYHIGLRWNLPETTE